MNILGISAFYHDSAAVLLKGGRIVAAAQEERFSRKKHDAGFPVHAIQYCLAEGRIGSKDLDTVVFYDKPVAKFMRIVETYFGVAPRGLRSFLMAMPIWIRQKLWIPYQIERALLELGLELPQNVWFTEHHESHAASAYYPSPFRRAAILTLDGVGEWATTTIGVGKERHLDILKEIRFPHSLGLLYSAMTYFCGFKVNSGEYKLMGLAPYGEPRYTETILDNLIDIRADGSFRLNMAYFGYLDSLYMTNQRFENLFDGPPRQPESEISQREMDLARSIQEVTEKVVLRMARHAHRLTGERNLCMAGGVALNCVANGRLLREGPFDDLFIQPASGDAGGALGAALFAAHKGHAIAREPDASGDSMQGALLGPAFSDEEIGRFLVRQGYPATHLAAKDWAPRIAQLLTAGNIVGLFQGRMEFGPRALGARSIIGDARSPEMQSKMNLKIKYRESFRPFAPSCLEENVSDYFELDCPSPYMLIVADVRRERRRPAGRVDAADLHAIINQARSDIPAVTHVDYSARVQTVARKTNPGYHDIISAFRDQTGYGVIINTSFNVRGEPIVCTPWDAYQCFMRTEMDHLVLGGYLLSKTDQPAWTETDDWRDQYALD
jgi:carbamoyltransferase